MGWQEIALLARDPLVTIGAHTVNHLALAKLPEKAVRSEMDLSRTVIEFGARRAAGASVLSVWRCRFGGRARIRHRGRARLQDGGDDATRCAVPLARQASHRAAAHLAQR